MDDNNKYILVIEPRRKFMYRGKIIINRVGRWLYFAKKHIKKQWLKKNNEVHCDKRYDTELIGGSRCGDTLEQAKVDAGRIMTERYGFNWEYSKD